MKKMKNFYFILFVGTLSLVSCSSESEPVIEEKPAKVVVKEIDKDYDYFMERISKDTGWMVEVEKQALELGITSEEALIKSAKFMATQNGFPHKEEGPTELEIQIGRIKNNEVWLSEIKFQAKERAISEDSMLVRAAKYTISQRE